MRTGDCQGSSTGAGPNRRCNHRVLDPPKARPYPGLLKEAHMRALADFFGEA